MRFLLCALLLVCMEACAHSRPREAAPAPIAVLTFNVRYGTALDGDNAWPKRREFFFETIRGADPDLIGFQEALAFQVKQTLEALPGYQAVYACRDDGKDKGESCAILYRAARFTLEDSGTFWLSDTPEVVASNTWNAGCPRVCTWVRLDDIQSHHPFYLFNTHLDHIREEARVKGMTLILSRIAARAHPEDPAILTGDFNAGEHSETVILATRNLTDTYRVKHPVDAASPEPAGTFNNFKNKTDGEKIDYILVPPDTGVSQAEIIRPTRDGRNASDHFAVTATFRLPESGHARNP